VKQKIIKKNKQKKIKKNKNFKIHPKEIARFAVAMKSYFFPPVN